MARAFRCKECGTGYSTTGDDTPTSPKWDDGHVCELVEVQSMLRGAKNINELSEEDKIELQEENRMKIIAQNGNTGEHYED